MVRAIKSSVTVTGQGRKSNFHGIKTKEEPMINTNSRRFFFISFYIISVMLVFMLFGSIKWLSYVRLMIDGTPANAVVTTTSCVDKTTFSYRFNVGEKSFFGSGGDGYGNKPCNTLKPGDAAMIFYVASDPGTNIPGDPGARFISEFAAIALVAFFVPILVLMLLFGVSKALKKRG
jgi:hypothetical protein